MLTATARLWLLAALPALSGNAGWVAVGEVVNAAVEASGPAFALQQRTTVLAAAGASGELACRVLHLGEQSVSWVRSRDLQILAHGGAPFTADTRVQAAATRVPRGDATTFTLRIAPLRAHDAGRYECQVNTEPKLSLFFNLTVLEEEMPHVVVSALREEERGLQGGAATLTCEARYEPAPHALPVPTLALTWRRRASGASPLQSVRGGVSLETERWGVARLVSRLTLAGLQAEDAGDYECTVPGEPAPEEPTPWEPAAAAVVTLRVATRAGEEGGESMQRDQSPLSAGTSRVLPALAGPVLAMLAALAGR